jgi:hypothetical protein
MTSSQIVTLKLVLLYFFFLLPITYWNSSSFITSPALNYLILTGMQVNYLAHFYLVRQLLPRLLTGALSCRVVVLTSESHRFSETTLGTQIHFL